MLCRGSRRSASAEPRAEPLSGANIMDGKIWEAVIIGGGPAGLAAGMHLARAGYRALLVERGRLGGQAALLEKVENYPGFPRGIAGRKLMGRWLVQARRWGLAMKMDEVLRLSRGCNGIFSVRLKNGGLLRARAVLWCAGAAFRALGARGERAFAGRGVWHLAGEAPFCAGKTVAVAGGGEAAVQQAVLLSRRARHVYLITRSGGLRAHRLLQERFSRRPNVEWLAGYEVARVSGGRTLRSIRLSPSDGRGAAKELTLDALFVLAGKEPVKAPAGWRSRPAGFFRAGDASGEIFRQIAVAGGEGMRAAMRCIRYLEGF